jgi:hypothetical protein
MDFVGLAPVCDGHAGSPEPDCHLTARLDRARSSRDIMQISMRPAQRTCYIYLLIAAKGPPAWCLGLRVAAAPHVRKSWSVIFFVPTLLLSSKYLARAVAFGHYVIISSRWYAPLDYRTWCGAAWISPRMFGALSM